MSSDIQMVAWSVAQAVEALNTQLFRIAGPNFLVEGEVGRVQVSQGKWVSFDLKDKEDGSILKCWGTVYQMPVLPEEGACVRVRSTPKVNGKYGQFSLQIHGLEYAGQGAWQAALKALREKLVGEGLLDESKKRPLPSMPECIGLITSRDAAAYGDFLRIVRQRWGGVEILFCPVAVQGDRVVESVCGALNRLASLPAKERPEVIVLTRGGGSAEELMMFNSEVLVRAVAASPIPTVVAIGHERDVCLAEEVADKRAATPTHAAECVTPDREAITRTLSFAIDQLSDNAEQAWREGCWRLERSLAAHASMLEAVVRRLDQAEHALARVGARVQEGLRERRERLAWGMQALARLAQHRHAQASTRVEGAWRMAQSLHPKRVLARGYAVVRAGGRIARRADALALQAPVEVELSQGTFTATVTHVCQP